jgi:DegV family protein with EDD domain
MQGGHDRLSLLLTKVESAYQFHRIAVISMVQLFSLFFLFLPFSIHSVLMEALFMGRFAVVTDSTSNLTPGLDEEYDVDVMVQNIHWGDDTFLDGVTLKADAFYRRLKERKDFPKTSQPSAGAFIAFFEEVAERRQVETILGVFVSSEMSGTLASALQAKADLAIKRPDLHIELVDSRSVSMGLGFQALVAARALKAGKTLQETLALVKQCYDSMDAIFAVDTLEYLHRGGRIGGAARLLGSALNLKPVLTIVDGRIESLEKVRSRRKSLRRVVEIIEERWAGRQPTEIAIIQAEAGDDLPWFTDLVESRIPCEISCTRILTPVVGTHGGPGTIGLVVYALDGDL